MVAKKSKTKKSSSSSKKSASASKKSGHKTEKKSSKHKKVNNNILAYAAGAVAFVAFVVLAFVIGSNLAGNGGTSGSDDAVVGTVDGIEIYQSQVEEIANLRSSQGAQSSNADIFQELVLREVLIADTKARGIYPTIEETEAEVEVILAQQGQTLDTFRSSLASQDVDYSSFIEEQRAGLGFERLIEELETIEVTEEEARAFYEENSDRLAENASYEELEESIIDFIRQERSNEILVSYGEGLAQDAEVVVLDEDFLNQETNTQPPMQIDPEQIAIE